MTNQTRMASPNEGNVDSNRKRPLEKLHALLQAGAQSEPAAAIDPSSFKVLRRGINAKAHEMRLLKNAEHKVSRLKKQARKP